MDGLDTMTVDLADKLATVTFDDSKTSAEAIAAAIEEAGFVATVANS
ncbi:cation transporter [Psychrobacter sp. A3]|nr:cation transporter [Psychrobacter sp. A3]MDE0492259.1 cation transporter [Psychrobacter sp. A3]